jgi:hypothetical protein
VRPSMRRLEDSPYDHTSVALKTYTHHVRSLEQSMCSVVMFDPSRYEPREAPFAGEKRRFLSAGKTMKRRNHALHLPMQTASFHVSLCNSL